tara:strand:- start:1913 stop:2104 length:192 start_codon:yes stop_codon:yes gene_type:complete
MYWLVLGLSVSGMPDMQMEMKMGSYFTCSIAKQKFEDSNPPNVFIEGKQKESNFESINCVKKD